MSLWSKHAIFEKNSIILLIGILIIIAIGGLVEIAPLFYLKSTIEQVGSVRPYSPLELAGRNIYVREGCYNCHSQMIRPLRDEVERYGHYSLAAESMYDRPFQWGSKRTGPDLARVGGKYSDDWQRDHLNEPKAVVPGTVMPSYPWLTGLLILAAVTLFLMNAVAGRVWCGYLCPQTVWTDLFGAIERLVEGDRREHLLLDRQRLSVAKVSRKVLKHFLWLMVAWWTGGAWVLYFSDAPTLVKDLATLQAPLIAYIWIAILTATTYLLAGHMREQVCLYMCPWPRIQAALTDEHALNVTYRYDRGEPRVSAKKGEALRLQGLPAGDCIDCSMCVNVCPTGVDIRDGASLGCIQCGLCIDACDDVMVHLGRPVRLIAYDTEVNIYLRQSGLEPIVRILRPRTVLYAVVIALVGAVMLYALATREILSANVIHDRNPVFVRLADGAIRNAYTVRILNKTLESRVFRLSFSGVTVASLELVEEEGGPTGLHKFIVGPDQTREIRALVTTYQALPAGASVPLTFIVTDTSSGARAVATDHFRGP